MGRSQIQTLYDCTHKCDAIDTLKVISDSIFIALSHGYKPLKDHPTRSRMVRLYRPRNQSDLVAILVGDISGQTVDAWEQVNKVPCAEHMSRTFQVGEWYHSCLREWSILIEEFFFFFKTSLIFLYYQYYKPSKTFTNENLIQQLEAKNQLSLVDYHKR